MGKLTWEELINADEFFGGKLVIREGVSLLRCGPLTRIERVEQGEVFYEFHTAWLAQYDIASGQWTCCRNQLARIEEKYRLRLENGKVFVGLGSNVMMLSLCPRGVEPLPEVIGLPLASRRLLALYPNLHFDRQVAERICQEKKATRTAPKIAALPDIATVEDALSQFSSDDAAEQFLWYYIEAITGERNVHRRVY